MRITHQFSIVAMAFCMMSCVTTTSYFRTLPPELVLPDDYQSASVISAFDTTRLDFNQEKKVTVFSNGAATVVKTLSEYLENEKQIVTTLSDSLITGNADVYHENDSIDSERRRRLCKRMDTDFLIVMESYSLDFYQDVDVVKNDDGSKTRTAYYDLVAGASIHLYDNQGELFDTWFHEARYIDYDVRQVLSGLLAIGPLMGNAGKEVNELSGDIGRNWVARLSPSEIEVVKSIYNHKFLRSSNNAMLRGDWQNAISILTPLASSDDPKTSGRASHNLSVAYEALNDLESARKWRNLAEQKLGVNYSFY
jgi:hypothetical protein